MALTNRDKLESIAQHIELAACTIQEDGWCRFNLFKDGYGNDVNEFPNQDIRGFCILGALYATCGDLPESSPIDLKSEQVSEASLKLSVFLGQSPATWNDMLARDKRDVVEHMLDCATWLRGKGGKKCPKGTVK